MLKKQKFKKGDIVYIKVWLWDAPEIGQIVCFDKKRGCYKMIYFLDNLDPESFWRWCYVNEDDIDFADSVIDVDDYKNSGIREEDLNDSNFIDIYDDFYYLAKKVYDGEIDKKEYYARLTVLTEDYLKKINSRN